MKHVLVLAVMAIVATILYSIVSGNERQSPTISPANHTCEINERVTFICHNITQAVLWQLNGVQLSASGNNSYSTENFNLHINCELQWNDTRVTCSDLNGERSSPARILIRAPEISVSPDDPICFLNQSIVLHCLGAEHISAWNYNQSVIQMNDTRFITTNSGLHLEVACVQELNNSIFSCWDSLGVRWESAPVKLRIQGLLDGVVDLKYIHENRTLSWGPPQQLNESEPIEYQVVVIAKATEQSYEQIIENSTSETFLDLSGWIEEGVTYNASLWAINTVGRGGRSSVEFVGESVSTSTSSSSEGSTLPTHDPPSPPDPPSGLNGRTLGLRIGLVLAVVLPVVLIIIPMAAVCIWQKRKKKKNYSPQDCDGDAFRGIRESKRKRKKTVTDGIRKRIVPPS